MKEKCVILGSNSFSGSWFVARALTQGLDALGISRSPQPIDAFLPWRWPAFAGAPGRFEFEQLDLNHDADRIAARIGAFHPDYVVNFAAQSMVAESWEHPDQWYQTNVVANVRLHDRLRHFSFLKKYVHVSTPEIYGSCTGNVTEDAPMNPSTPYAASRAACDLHLATFLKRYRFPVAFTRSANVYGAGQQLYRIIPRTILCILLGRKLQLHGGGRSVRSFIHGRDVADATLQIARQAPPGEVYHLSTARYVSIRQLVELVCQKMNADFKKVVEIADDRPGKDAAYLLDSSKARRTLGWTDKISLEEGVAETVAWIKEHLEVLKTLPLDYVHKP